MIHFDVLLPSGVEREVAIGYAKEFLTSIGENVEDFKSERCNYCHSEVVEDNVAFAIECNGYFISQMEGCPDPIF